MVLQYLCMRLRPIINVEIEIVSHAILEKEIFFRLVKKLCTFSAEIWFHLNK